MNPDDLRERLINAMAALVANSGWTYDYDDPNSRWSLSDDTYIDMLGDGSLTIQIAAPDYDRALPAMDAVEIAVSEHVVFMADA